MTDADKHNIDKLNTILHKIVFASQVSDMPIFKGSVKDLNEAELTILSVVNGKPDIVLKEISTMFKMPPSTLTSAIDRLEKKGYLNRVISRRDRRSYGLELTQKGRDIVEQHVVDERDSLAAILAHLDSEEEKTQFVALLSKIVDKAFCDIDFTQMLGHIKPLL